MRIRLGPWQALAVFAAAWVAVDMAFEFARDQLLGHLQLGGLRETVALRALFNIAVMWTIFAACVLILRVRRQKLVDIGWRQPASPRAWVLGIVVAILVSGAALGSVGRSAQLLSDWSLYRISLAIVMGGSAGVCLETIFRGFVMTQARDAGTPVAIQILLSAVLFALALARFGWGGAAIRPSFGVLVATTVSWAILGAALAIIYVVGRRSLTPAIFAHAAIDMVVEPGMALFAAMGGVVR